MTRMASNTPFTEKHDNKPDKSPATWILPGVPARPQASEPVVSAISVWAASPALGP